MAQQTPFARAPGELLSGEYLDYSSRTGMNLYKMSTESLHSSPEECFDLQADGLTHFMNKLKARAHEMGWDQNVLLIETDLDNMGGPNSHFLDSHGTFTLEHIQQVEAHHNAQQSRTSQNSFMMCKAILNSLTPEATTRVNNRGSEWIIKTEVDGEEMEIASGVCLLKVILIISQQETKSTMAHILQQLTDLHPLMDESDCNIEAFNIKINELINKVRKADRSVPESLLMSLFDVCASVPDQDFRECVRTKRNKCTDEDLDLNPSLLMQGAEQKCFDLVNNQRTWRAPSEADKKIAALTTTVASLTKKVKQSTSGGGSGRGAGQGGGGRGGGRGFIPGQGQPGRARPDWLVKQVKPKDVHATREWNGRTWRWCCEETGGKCSGKWVTHSAQKCEGPAFRAKRNPSTRSPTQQGKVTKKQKPSTVIHQSTIEQDESDEQDDPSELQAALAQAHTESQVQRGVGR